MAIFSSARLKLERAKSFVAELRSLMRHHLETNPPTIEITEVAEPEGNSMGGVGGKFSIPESPQEAGVIIGDVVHSLRTALDHAASELARMNEKNDKHVRGERIAGLFNQCRNQRERARDTQRQLAAGATAVRRGAGRARRRGTWNADRILPCASRGRGGISVPRPLRP